MNDIVISEKTIKKMDIKEFLEGGFLQEVNRQFFHPLGIALVVKIDKEKNVEDLFCIWDCRDDPEGIVFEREQISVEKANYIKELFDRVALHRKNLYGFVIQPVPDAGTDETISIPPN